VLLDGGVLKGDPQSAWSACARVVEGSFETKFVEHAYIEPEAGMGRAYGRSRRSAREHADALHGSRRDRDRDEACARAVRVVPSACGGGFGGKLDIAVQPLVALGAWLTGRTVACVYSRPESMASTTKRHPARIAAKFGCDADGRLLACEVDALFDTGAYASWGPTVATRVPIHATGPYAVPNVRTRGRAFFTHCHPSGAFRGFGVPQGAIAHEAMMDALADRLSIDRLEFRRRNALRPGDRTATGQLLEHSAGLGECLDALEPQWRRALADCASFNAHHRTVKRGAGIGCMWYGIGNTALSNPSTMRSDFRPRV
jgi:CO/xanthine dehydrogenase Mo-binding subunit